MELTNRKNYLVIGDWNIDQNWICGIQRSSISSRTGKIHLRGLNKNDGATESLCGAGAVASILHRAITTYNGANIIGIGAWHEEDEVCLKNMVHSADQRILQPSHLFIRRRSSEEDKTVKLINLSSIVYPDNIQNHTTTRVIRIYQKSGSKINFLSRVDWEFPLPQNRDYWISSESDAQKVIRSLSDEPDLDSVDAVIIKCLNKKVVSPELIKALAKIEKLKDVPWYISSKQWNPCWLRYLKDVNCRLFLIPQVAIETAKRSGVTTKWINSNGNVTQKALEFLDIFSKSFKSKDSPLITVLPSGHRILAMDKNNEVIIQNERETFFVPPPVETPFASILFGSLIVLDQNKNGKIDAKSALEKALEFARDYIHSENLRLTKPEEWNPKNYEVNLNLKEDSDESANDSINNKNIYVETPPGRIDWKGPYSHKQEQIKWEKATTGLGIIDYGTSDDIKYCLELSRAATEIDEYICLNYENRRNIQKLFNELKDFKKGNRDKSASCKIVASPGSGKSRLAKSITKMIDYNYLEFNISQIYNKEHLTDLFDRVSTEQANDPDKPLLVFVDEINSMINNEYVYGSFLAPLEDGIYVRAEKMFHIAPCFWLFAETDVKNENENAAENKKDDFESRLTLSDIYLKNRHKERNLENVYTGALILIKTFPDVSFVTRKVLFIFWLLGSIKEFSPRKLVQFIRSFSDIQLGKVTLKNVHFDKLIDYVKDMKIVYWDHNIVNCSNCGFKIHNSNDFCDMNVQQNDRESQDEYRRVSCLCCLREIVFEKDGVDNELKIPVYGEDLNEFMNLIRGIIQNKKTSEPGSKENQITIKEILTHLKEEKNSDSDDYVEIVVN